MKMQLNELMNENKEIKKPMRYSVHQAALASPECAASSRGLITCTYFLPPPARKASGWMKVSGRA